MNNRKLIEIPIENIVRSENNVHNAEKISDPDFKNLVDNIRKNGLICSIVVRPGAEKGKYIVVDGHRRLAACKRLKMSSVNAEVLELSDPEAMVATINANEHRTANDPILVAEQIERLMASGLSTKEIAAVLTVSEDMVLVRARLTNLVKEWRDFGKTHDCTVDLLERVAAYEPEIQSEVARDSEIEKYASDDTDETLRYSWADFKYEFENRMFRIENANFPTSACSQCAFNTATHGLLFKRFTDGDKAQCEKHECYIAKFNTRTEELVTKLKESGNPVIEVASKYYIPGNPTVRKTAVNSQPYLYVENRLKYIVWSFKVEKNPSKRLNTEEDRINRKYKKNLNLAFSRIRQTPVFGDSESSDRDQAIGELVTSDIAHKFVTEWIRHEMAKDSGTKDYDDDIIWIVRMCGGVSEFASRFDIAFTDDEREALERKLAEEYSY